MNVASLTKATRVYQHKESVSFSTGTWFEIYIAQMSCSCFYISWRWPGWELHRVLTLFTRTGLVKQALGSLSFGKGRSWKICSWTPWFRGEIKAFAGESGGSHDWDAKNTVFYVSGSLWPSPNQKWKLIWRKTWGEIFQKKINKVKKRVLMLNFRCWATLGYLLKTVECFEIGFLGDMRCFFRSTY